VDRGAAYGGAQAARLQVFVFLLLLTGLLYFTKKKIWADAH